MARSRKSIVRNIHSIYTFGDILGALRFGGKLPCSGDLVCLQLAISECEKLGAGGLLFIAVLCAASEVERKTGFITYKILESVYGKSYSSQVLMKLVKRGLLEPAPFPDTFSHILRHKRVFRISDKGRKCLRLFADVFNMYQREVKRAKTANV